MRINTEWTMKDGLRRNVFSTFPYAFRHIYNMIEAANKDPESKRKSKDIIDSIYLLSPTGKLYTYTDALKLAQTQNLVNNEGQLNSKEFKRK